MVVNPYEPPRAVVTQAGTAPNGVHLLIALSIAVLSTFILTTLGFIFFLSQGLDQSPFELSRQNVWYAINRAMFCSALSLIPVLICVFQAKRQVRLLVAFAVPSLVAVVTSLCFFLWTSFMQG